MFGRIRPRGFLIDRAVFPRNFLMPADFRFFPFLSFLPLTLVGPGFGLFYFSCLTVFVSTNLMDQS
ncbi:hypothetical protein A2303_05600 [Candidatus Falkowbacteria bacterium RIFOXYB2_FULL_47_14]|uniref:Uncharacterized protein n=1 Tax=Candidatus Falkowbacteria bacterium RIFOXYA2_FULL_47_19 TaxID=1797994 RepID=A0A1F5SED7_9BACT|nr:MAG: hypothetical protein A2227_07000 [Candidatus Falkowbacteria bacterium RIFOXYA2_FULL_47_19]OGF43760.1 MAG: hypothetical protein A2303_05600 [Candidatus Falkowbacteria bacterium RIFOXYB2_FULL_47_14]